MSQPSSEESVRRDLRAAGLRVTDARVAVMQLLRRAAMPLSHPDVVAALADHGWDRVTLYRNLTDLARAGLAHRTDLGDRVWRYAVAGRDAGHDHPHFVCRSCGAVVCLADVQVRVRATDGDPVALREQEFEVQLKGRCDRCREETP